MESLAFSGDDGRTAEGDGPVSASREEQSPASFRVFFLPIARGRSVEFAGGEIPLRRKDAGERMDTDKTVGVVDSTVGQGERL